MVGARAGAGRRDGLTARPDSWPGGAASVRAGGSASSPSSTDGFSGAVGFVGSTGQLLAAAVLLGLPRARVGRLAGGDLGERGLRAGDGLGGLVDRPHPTTLRRVNALGQVGRTGLAHVRGRGLDGRAAGVELLDVARRLVQLVLVVDLAVAISVGLLRIVGFQPLLRCEAVRLAVGIDAAGPEFHPGAVGVLAGDRGVHVPAGPGLVGFLEHGRAGGQLLGLPAGGFGVGAQLGGFGFVDVGRVGAGGPDRGVLPGLSGGLVGGVEFVGDVAGRPVLLALVGDEPGA